MVDVRKPYRTKFRLFEGNFHDAEGQPTTHVRWATSPLSLPDGPVDGRLRVRPRTNYGIPEGVSELPGAAQAVLELNNADGQLATYLSGTGGKGVSHEYRWESFLNLKGKIYACELKPDGTYEKRALTPLLACSGAPSFTETTIQIPMASDDQPILGRPRPMLRMSHLRDAEVLELGDLYQLIGGERTLDYDQWGEVAGSVTENLDLPIPHAYGRTKIPLIQADQDGRCYVLFAARHKPRIDDVADWQFTGPADDLTGAPFSGREELTERAHARIGSVRLGYWDDEGEAREAWVVFLTWATFGREYDGTIYALPGPGNLLSANKPGRQRLSPVSVARWIVEDLSETGEGAVDEVSFDAAARALPLPDVCGGLVTGEGTIGELLTHIGQPWALAWWVGLDDRLHVGAAGQWTDADRNALLSSDTPRIGPADFASGYGALGCYQETIPANPAARGCATRRVAIDWADRQTAAWPADHLPRWSPGATALPVQPSDETRISGHWLFPPAAIPALASSGARRTFPARRIQLRIHDGLSTRERATLAILTMKRAGPGEYVDRAIRLEHTADDEREHVVARFEDLGSTAAQRPAMFDTIDNWIGLAPGSGQGISVAAGSDLVWMGVGNAAEKYVGMHLHTPGGMPANRRIARRIVAVVDTAQVRVEFPFVDSETLFGVAGKPVLEQPWCILKSQETKPGNDRFLAAADETTGEFRDGTPGFTVAAG